MPITDRLQDYLLFLWNGGYWEHVDPATLVFEDLSARTRDGSSLQLIERLFPIFSLCCQGRGLSKGPEELAAELLRIGSVSVNGQTVDLYQLSRLVLALMCSEFAMDSLAYGPRTREIDAAKWRELERISTWEPDDLRRISHCWRTRSAKFQADTLKEGA